MKQGAGCSIPRRCNLQKPVTYSGLKQVCMHWRSQCIGAGKICSHSICIGLETFGKVGMLSLSKQSLCIKYWRAFRCGSMLLQVASGIWSTSSAFGCMTWQPRSLQGGYAYTQLELGQGTSMVCQRLLGSTSLYSWGKVSAWCWSKED
eukprot:1157153-Pelagomonas_calceolata.AAC.7